MKLKDITGKSLRATIEEAVLTEFQLDHKIKWTVRDENRWVGDFEVNRTRYQLLVRIPSKTKRIATTGFWSLDNEGVPSQYVTGEGGFNARLIFGYVLSGIYEFLREKRPNGILFVADEDAPSRVSLYKALVRWAAPRVKALGYEPLGETLGGEGWMGFTKTKVDENASSGATCAGNIAVSPGGRAPSTQGAIGAGFDPNGDWGIYEKPKKAKKSKGPSVLRR